MPASLLTSDISAELIQRSATLLEALRRAEAKLVTAESCTGGLVAALLTHHAGSSDVTEGGLVTYSNSMKQSVLGVRPDTLRQFGAVSAETVREMASGALGIAQDATHSVSISGIAGPGGGSAEKPVGLVWFGTAVRGGDVRAEARIFKGDRTEVRSQAALYALALVALRLD
ncbi:CinA family protein [Acetobacter cerevisiae]|uniref:CinA family protein n=1 Tax=Acetobacter cerevisiae TaxID=178900 RepID=UPI0009E90773|nr:nicotinamide-nucleotide amidohydrolase family protein [Acetobacter cerevisiae]